MTRVVNEAIKNLEGFSLINLCVFDVRVLERESEEEEEDATERACGAED